MIRTLPPPPLARRTPTLPPVDSATRSSIRIVVVDDERTLRESCHSVLEAEGYNVALCGRGNEARETLKRRHFDIALVDWFMGEVPGSELLQTTLATNPGTIVIIMTGNPSVASSLEALQAGAWDYLPKPFSGTQLQILVGRAAHAVLVARESRLLEEQRAQQPGGGDKISVLGDSPLFRKAIALARRVAATDASVFLTGESGAGKELFAKFIHDNSRRSSRSLVAVNCAALPEPLLESEMFGHCKGAFTGAVRDKPGLLETANGGTLFLDEVAELGPSSQAKVLQLLEQREFQRLGGAQIFRTDARILAATTHDLAKAVADGDFRADLYERLNACVIHLPPLRERRDDIVPLSDALLAEIGRGIGRPPSDLSRDARGLLADYAWPGNVRELRNVLERAAILSGGGVITAAHLALDVATKLTPSFVANVAAAGVAASSQGDLHSMERVMIEQALHSSRFNKSKAAKVLGLTRQQLYVRLRKYGLE